MRWVRKMESLKRGLFTFFARLSVAVLLTRRSRFQTGRGEGRGGVKLLWAIDPAQSSNPQPSGGVVQSEWERPEARSLKEKRPEARGPTREPAGPFSASAFHDMDAWQCAR